MLVLIVPWWSPGLVEAQDDGLRVVIASNVACRKEPSTTVAAVLRNEVGDVFVPRDRRDAADGRWYLDSTRTRGGVEGCWIHGSLTASWSDREGALLKAAERILDRREGVAFDELIAVDNFLVQTESAAHRGVGVIDESPAVQLRRLQLLGRAGAHPDVRRSLMRSHPLRSAWFFANREVLRYYEPGGVWIVDADSYWRLYEEYEESEWAEEIAWVAAQQMFVGDECDAPCILEGVLHTFARYWTMFPEGERVEEAFDRASKFARHAAQVGCVWRDVDGLRQVSEELRNTLSQADPTDVEAFVARLAEVERACIRG